MSSDVQQSELEAQEEELIKQIDQLDRSWPSDGWDGAAMVIAQHVQRIRALEQQLAPIHEQHGRHRPDLKRYYPPKTCYCGINLK